MDQTPFEAPDAAQTAAELSAITPMMAQFLEIKAVNPGYLLFYRMGDFYEMFFEDAEIASQALGIVLTKRGKHQGADIPMCGVPIHAAQDYLKKLISLGHRVAICEQVEDPAEAKKRGSQVAGQARRRPARHPRHAHRGRSARPPAAANYLAALAMVRHGETDFALAWADVSTGETAVLDIAAEASPTNSPASSPPNCCVSDADPRRAARRTRSCLPEAALVQLPAQLFDSAAGAAIALPRPFPVARSTRPPSRAPAARRFGALCDYVRESQKGVPVALARPPPRRISDFMAIDAATRASLELLVTQRGEEKGALRSEIDLCVTPAGSRLLARASPRRSPTLRRSTPGSMPSRRWSAMAS